MPKEIRSGKQSMQQHCMDATIAMNKASNAVLDQITHLDAAIRADLADDEYMKNALKALVSAADETNAAAKEGLIKTALENLQAACEIDFADTSIEAAKGALMPAVKTIDECKHAFLDLQSKLARKAAKDGGGE